MPANTSVLGKIRVKLAIEASNEKLLWPSLDEVKDEDDDDGVRFSDGTSFKLEEGKSINGRTVFEGDGHLKENDFVHSFPRFLDRKMMKVLTIQVSRHVARWHSNLADANTAVLRAWLDDFTVDGIPPGAHTLCVRGELDKWALGDFLRSSRSDGLHVLQTDGGNGRAKFIPGHYLQEVVEALENSNTSLTVFCEVLDPQQVARTVAVNPPYSWPRAREVTTTPAHGDNCTCWKDTVYSQGRTRIVRRLKKLLERNKELNNRVKCAVADVLIPARVLLYAKSQPVPMVWKWNWRWSAGLWDEKRQWKAKRVKQNKTAPASSSLPTPSPLTKLPAEVLERIIKYTADDAEALTTDQWCRFMRCVRDRDAFRSQSRATADFEGPEFAVTMDEWLHNGKMWWDRGVPPAETPPAKRRKVAGGE
ncbi:uncharacterized protein LOC62_03G003943 [Vanrija pseudolonga]|uniref:Uncharacterized protein n=1 Tax=Vanrija pseudolonga TaxID=143232 RepID=A0AAF0Y5F6_9TREE|nr:hypothetical protein LOC62_03G003943 [Vanrija pseudolonga]